jgi:hypothetical protein
MATDNVRCTAKSIATWIIFLGPQCPCVGKRKTKRNPSSCPSSFLYKIPLPLWIPHGLRGSLGAFLSMESLSNSFLPAPYISRALPIKYAFCPSRLLCHRCSMCWLSRIFLLLGLPCSWDSLGVEQPKTRLSAVRGGRSCGLERCRFCLSY